MPVAAGIAYAESKGGSSLQPPLVLIHGAGSDHLCWPAELRRLPGWRVLAIDLPGHGRSDGVACQSIAACEARVLEMLDDLGIYSAALVGHSMGGAVALQVALDHPERVKALGLLACGGRIPVPQELLDSLVTPLKDAELMACLPRWLFSPSTPVQRVRQWLQPINATRRSVLKMDWRVSSQFNLEPFLRSIRVPAWVALGGDDRLLPEQTGRYLARRLRNARLEIIPGAGHLLMLEQPVAVSRGLLAFLNSLDLS